MPERGFNTEFWEDPFEGVCESPIEKIFARECSKYLDSGVSFDCQVEVQTRHERFRIDFVLEGVIAVECDGRDFHNSFRDEFRDAILLGEEHFLTIYHFRGCDLTYYPEDCIWLISLENPGLFTERGRHQLNCLHELEIVPYLTHGEIITLRDPTNDFRRVRVFRRDIEHKLCPNPNWPYWRELHEFASQHPRVCLDRLIALWERRFAKEGQS
jgi:very-short-patch-repair endonuclease